MTILRIAEFSDYIKKNNQSFCIYEILKNKKILEYKMDSKTEGTIFFNFGVQTKKLVRDSLERLGLMPITSEFFASKEGEWHLENKFDSHLQEGFGEWFLKIAEKSDIWLDTNILIFNSIEQVVYGPKKVFDEGSQIYIVIPRFSIFELERLSNQEKNKWSKENGLKEIEKYLQKVKRCKLATLRLQLLSME